MEAHTKLHKFKMNHARAQDTNLPRSGDQEAGMVQSHATVVGNGMTIYDVHPDISATIGRPSVCACQGECRRARCREALGCGLDEFLEAQTMWDWMGAGFKCLIHLRQTVPGMCIMILTFHGEITQRSRDWVQIACGKEQHSNIPYCADQEADWCKPMPKCWKIV